MHPRHLLAVWAHPDDEAFGPVGTICLAHAHGWETAIITATRGDAGKSEQANLAPGQTLGELREGELRCAAAVTRISQIHVWDYADGGVQDVPQAELVAKILDVMRDWQPTIVLTFGPDGITGHPDHIAIGAAAERAFHQLRSESTSDHPLRLYYVTTRPGRTIEHPMGDAPPLGVPTTVLDVSAYEQTKRAALACHASQQDDWEPLLADHDWLTTDRLVRAFPPVALNEPIETTIFHE